MTGDGVLTGDKPKAKVKEATSTIGKLQTVVALINQAKKHNEVAQAQFASGSPSWAQCELIDDRLHEALVQLGE